MGEIITFLLSLGFIWIGYGFGTLAVLVAAWLLLAWIGQPKYSWDTNWANVISKCVLIVIGLFAIQDHWQNPILTAIAIATALILFFKVD